MEYECTNKNTISTKKKKKNKERGGKNVQIRTPLRKK